MEIYAQHGSQKGDKIDIGLESGALSGVVLSPKDIKRSDIEEYVTHLNTKSRNLGAKCRILFDPQFYVSHLDNSHRFGHGNTYDYFRSDLSRSDFRSARTKLSFVEDCLEFQNILEIDTILSPAVLVEGFADYSGELALELCQTSIETHSNLNSSKALMLSLPISESAFTDDLDMSYFLDELSEFRPETKELYIAFKRTERSFPAPVTPEVYSRLLYFLDSLVNKNGFNVVVGYSDLFGLGFHATGASATASGWSQNQKQLTLSQWNPSRGGGLAKIRYTSKPLLSQILVEPELRIIKGKEELLEEVLSGNIHDSVFQSPYSSWSNSWNQNISHQNNWLVLSELARELSQGSAVQNLTLLLEKIDSALVLWEKLKREGVPFENLAATIRLKELKKGIELYVSTFA